MRPIRKSRVRILVEHSITIDEMINRLVEAETLFGVAREDVRVGLLHPGRNKLDLGVSYHIGRKACPGRASESWRVGQVFSIARRRLQCL